MSTVTIRQRNTLPVSWNVEDEEHRSLGTITQATGFGFFIHSPRQGTRLAGVGLGPYATLGDAVRRIADHMKATCVFSS